MFIAMSKEDGKDVRNNRPMCVEYAYIAPTLRELEAMIRQDEEDSLDAYGAHEMEGYTAFDTDTKEWFTINVTLRVQTAVVLDVIND